MAEILAAVLGSSVLSAVLVAWLQRGKFAAETREINARADAIERGIADEKKRIDDFQFVLSHMLSLHEQGVLDRLAGEGEAQFGDGHRERDHIRRILDLGFAQKGVKNVADLRQGDRLTEHYPITAAGQKYRELRKSAARD